MMVLEGRVVKAIRKHTEISKAILAGTGNHCRGGVKRQRISRLCCVGIGKMAQKK